MHRSSQLNELKQYSRSLIFFTSAHDLMLPSSSRVARLRLRHRTRDNPHAGRRKQFARTPEVCSHLLHYTTSSRSPPLLALLGAALPPLPFPPLRAPRRDSSPSPSNSCPRSPARLYLLSLSPLAALLYAFLPPLPLRAPRRGSTSPPSSPPRFPRSPAAAQALTRTHADLAGQEAHPVRASVLSERGLQRRHPAAGSGTPTAEWRG
mmetsp:Transcript_3808/g.9260  ORF Transcript_3808/g.9260 Transcript_3808/m.9260 type:complete len:207 (+) Transcript_3808:360-980(+)